MMKKILTIIGMILTVGGIIFTILPHETHNTIISPLVVHDTTEHSHLMEHGTHDTHRNSGLIAAGIGLIIIFITKRV